MWRVVMLRSILKGKFFRAIEWPRWRNDECRGILSRRPEAKRIAFVPSKANAGIGFPSRSVACNSRYVNIAHQQEAVQRIGNTSPWVSRMKREAFCFSV